MNYNPTSELQTSHYARPVVISGCRCTGDTETDADGRMIAVMLPSGVEMWISHEQTTDGNALDYRGDKGDLAITRAYAEDLGIEDLEESS